MLHLWLVYVWSRRTVRTASCSSTRYASSASCASESTGSVTCPARSQSVLTPSVTSSRIHPTTSDFCRQTRQVTRVVLLLLSYVRRHRKFLQLQPNRSPQSQWNMKYVDQLHLWLSLPAQSPPAGDEKAKAGMTLSVHVNVDFTARLRYKTSKPLSFSGCEHWWFLWV